MSILSIFCLKDLNLDPTIYDFIVNTENIYLQMISDHRFSCGSPTMNIYGLQFQNEEWTFQLEIGTSNFKTHYPKLTEEELIRFIKLRIFT